MSYVEPYIVSNSQILYGEEETAYRTKSADLTNYLRLHSAPTLPWPEREVLEVHAPGHGRVPAYVNDEGKQDLPFTLPFEVIDGRILGAIFGECVTAGVDPYTHTFNITSTMPKSFSLQHAFLKTGSNLVSEFLGCRAGKATFKTSEDDLRLLCDLEGLAALPQDGGATPDTLTPSTTKPYNFKQGVFSSTQLWSGTKLRVHDFELPINLNLKSNYASGYQYHPYDVLPGKATFSDMSVTVGLEDDTEWNEIYDQTKVGTVYDYSYVFTRGANDTLAITGNAKIKKKPLDIDDHDVRAKIAFVPSTCQIVVTDSIATYPFE